MSSFDPMMSIRVAVFERRTRSRALKDFSMYGSSNSTSAETFI